MIPPEQSGPTLDDDLGQGSDPRILRDLVALIPSAVDKNNFVWNTIYQAQTRPPTLLYRMGMMLSLSSPSVGAKSSFLYQETPAKLSPANRGRLSVSCAFV